MTYPYIGELKSGSGGIAIFASKESAAKLNDCGLNWGSSDKYIYHDFWNEGKFQNITAEYLANTYGEVKSKEHAEFIVKLAEVNKVVVCDVYRDSHKFFAVIDSSLLFFNSGAIAMKDGRKQITIPLPPECEKPPIGGGGQSGAEFADAKNNTKQTDSEHPKVGDEVEVCFESIVIGGKLLALTKEYAILSQGQREQHFHLNSWSLVKPKTPEQELRDDISDLAFNQFNDDSYDLTHNAYYLAEKLISEYDIKKKPQ